MIGDNRWIWVYFSVLYSLCCIFAFWIVPLCYIFAFWLVWNYFERERFKKEKQKTGIVICYQVDDITVFFVFIKINKCPLFILFPGYVYSRNKIPQVKSSFVKTYSCHFFYFLYLKDDVMQSVRVFHNVILLAI